MMNQDLYSMIYEVVEEFDSSDVDHVMDTEMFGLYNKIDDFLAKYQGISVGVNLGDVKNTSGSKILI